MHPGQPDAGDERELAKPPGRCVPVHPEAALVEQQRPGGAVAGGEVDGAADRGWQRDQHDLAALAVDPYDAVAVFLAEVIEADAGCLEHPQPEQAE